MRNPRAHLYTLLARLYLSELDTALAADLVGLPGFDALLPPPFQSSVFHPQPSLSSWLDTLAVEYQRLFGLEVYPYESLFVDDDLMLNTAATERVVGLYEACGFDGTGARVGAPDHLGLELRLMGELAEAEAAAEAVGDRARQQWARQMQSRCLDEHLARWAPLCALTLARVARQPLYHLVATLTAELVASDVAEYGGHGEGGEARKSGVGRSGQVVRRETSAGEDFEPEAPTSFRSTDEDDGPGVGAIVRELLTPARVGLWVCRADMRAIGQGLGLPVPMGERGAMLRGLFQAAGEFEQAPSLLAALDRLTVEMDERVTGLRDQYPAWGSHAAAWQARLADGRARLAALRQQADANGQSLHEF